eukprot:TRINITY_DN61136_c0_g1_i1.p1 TRINITY_DN61136_c0_g1~~TRINITY_DN61136_c0_g1_i1.p1  ORF type:complete len:438 (+),score=80.03 TRINITY_DN61136_c0_g1_i1:692-2005(+)
MEALTTCLQTPRRLRDDAEQCVAELATTEEQERSCVCFSETEEPLGAAAPSEQAFRAQSKQEADICWEARVRHLEREQESGRRALAEDLWGLFRALHISCDEPNMRLTIFRMETHMRFVLTYVETFERAPLAQRALTPGPTSASVPPASVAAVVAAIATVGHAAGLPQGELSLLAETMELRAALRGSQREVRELRTRLRGQHPQGGRPFFTTDDVADGVGRCAPGEWALVARRGAQAAREAKLSEHRAWAMLAGGLYLTQAAPGMLGHPHPGVQVDTGLYYGAKQELRDMREEIVDMTSTQRFTPFAAWLERIDALLEMYEMRRLEIGILAREATLCSRRAYTAYRALEPPSVPQHLLSEVTEQPELLPPLLQTGQPQGPLQQIQQQVVLPPLQLPQPRERRRRREDRREPRQCLTLIGMGVIAAVLIGPAVAAWRH